MTDTSTVDVVFTDTKPSRHKWPRQGDVGFTHTLAHESKDGNERFERICKACGMTRITIVPPRGWAWHEWKRKRGDVSFQMESTPPCPGGEKA